MSSGFGVVRAVNSGDSVSIFETVRGPTGGYPPIRDIYLSNIQAPKLGYNNGTDKPWAWESREFLRELCIGQKVKFTVEHKTANENPREYGSVVTDSGTNLAEAIALAGWAEVRAPPEGKEARTEEHKTLLLNQEQAKEGKLGIWQDGEGSTGPSGKLNSLQFFDKHKEKPVDAIIEYVRDANSYTVALKDTREKFNLRVAGVSAPRVPSKAKQEAGEKPEPVGLEAKFFIERHLLNRTVVVVITAPGEAKRQNEFYGSISFAGRSLASQLIKNGYGKLVEWNAPPKEVDELKKLQKEAIGQKLRIWKHIEAVESAGKRKEWSGKVCEVRDGSSIVVQDSVTGEKKFIILSNVKVPRMTKSEVQPYSYEAREHIRKKVIGKKVTVMLDYERNDVDFCSVFLDKKSLAVMLVEAGLANVVSYDDNEKSIAYQDLTIAENRAKDKGKNLWNKSKTAPIYRVTDTTLRQNDAEKKQSKQKAKQFFGALQRAGRVDGIVEYVFNASRLKVSIPNEKCIITFGLEAIRTPTKEENEELSKEVHDFVYDKLQQRDVQLIVENSDQAGNFFGSLFINAKNLGITLLEMGYAKLNHSSVDYTNYANEYKEAEESAKKKRIRIWANYSAEEKQATSQSNESKQIRLYKVNVSEVIDGNWFYVQMVDDAKVLDSIMKQLNEEDHPFVPNLSVKKGSLFAAKMPDNVWYRVKVEKIDKGNIGVVCVDFGMGITVDRSELRPLSPKLASAPIQAKECKLAYLQIPAIGEDYGEEAADYFEKLTSQKQLLASVEHIDGGISYISLGDEHSLINVQMVGAGYGVLSGNLRTDDPRKQKLIEECRKKETEARRNRVGRWELGDFRDDDF